MLLIDEFKELFDIERLPKEDNGLYQTMRFCNDAS